MWTARTAIEDALEALTPPLPGMTNLLTFIDDANPTRYEVEVTRSGRRFRSTRMRYWFGFERRLDELDARCDVAWQQDLLKRWKAAQQFERRLAEAGYDGDPKEATPTLPLQPMQCFTFWLLIGQQAPQWLRKVANRVDIVRKSLTVADAVKCWQDSAKGPR
jgi:hypothetical protein